MCMRVRAMWGFAETVTFIQNKHNKHLKCVEIL